MKKLVLAVVALMVTTSSVLACDKASVLDGAKYYRSNEAWRDVTCKAYQARLTADAHLEDLGDKFSIRFGMKSDADVHDFVYHCSVPERSNDYDMVAQLNAVPYIENLGERLQESFFHYYTLAKTGSRETINAPSFEELCARAG